MEANTPAGAHDIPIRGSDVIRNALLPIYTHVMRLLSFDWWTTQLSEEAQQRRNKEYEMYTEHRTKTISLE